MKARFANFESEKWNTFKLFVTPSNFWSDTSELPDDFHLSEKTICSTVVIETYKLILSQMQRDKPDQYNGLISKFMALFSRSFVKTLEGYLRGNENYTLFIRPSWENSFDNLSIYIDESENNRAKMIYRGLLDKFNSHSEFSEYSQHLKSRIFAANLSSNIVQFDGMEDIYRVRYDETELIETFLISQGIYLREMNSDLCHFMRERNLYIDLTIEDKESEVTNIISQLEA